jgi:hypothetical protein
MRAVSPDVIVHKPDPCYDSPHYQAYLEGDQLCDRSGGEKGINNKASTAICTGTSYAAIATEQVRLRCKR